MSRDPQYRNICFTINAGEGDELRLLDFSHSTWAPAKYCIYQREMGEHEHFQGYLELSRSMTFKQLHLLEGLETAHFEKRMGTAKQASHYCAKPLAGCHCNVCNAERAKPTYLEGPWEFGEISHQGQRSELIAIQRDMNQGKSLKEIALDNFPEWVRFGKMFKEYRRMIAQPRQFKPIIILIVGPSGLGKSRFAHVLASFLQGNSDYFIVPEKTTGTLWCDDYDGQDVFLMDEVDGSRFRPTFFNGLVDRYPFVVPCHGGAGSHMISKYMIFVSNYLPKYWWKKRSVDQLKQTTRRIDVVIPFFGPTIQYRHDAWQSFGDNINKRPRLSPSKPPEASSYSDPEPIDDPWSEDIGDY